MILEFVYFCEIHVYIYIYIHTYLHIYIYIYKYVANPEMFLVPGTDTTYFSKDTVGRTLQLAKAKSPPTSTSCWTRRRVRWINSAKTPWRFWKTLRRSLTKENSWRANMPWLRKTWAWSTMWRCFVRCLMIARWTRIPLTNASTRWPNTLKPWTVLLRVLRLISVPRTTDEKRMDSHVAVVFKVSTIPASCCSSWFGTTFNSFSM